MIINPRDDVTNFQSTEYTESADIHQKESGVDDNVIDAEEAAKEEEAAKAAEQAKAASKAAEQAAAKDRVATIKPRHLELAEKGTITSTDSF